MLSRPRPHGSVQTRIGALALVFVVLSLAALLVVPVLVQREIDSLRERGDEAADPARTLVTEIQYHLARQMSSLRGYLITGDQHYVDRYTDAVTAARQAFADLRPRAELLGPGVLARLDTLQARADRWHREVDPVPDLIARNSTSLLSFDGSSYTEIHGTAAALDSAVAAAAQQNRGEIRRAEEIGLLVTVGLSLLALASAVTVGWLGRRVQLLAEEAEAQRREAEHALEEARRATEERNRLIRGITHDVKNPLGAADGYASLLQMGIVPLQPEQAGWVAGVRRSIHAALGIINDLLNLALAESGQLPIELAAVDLGSVVREAVEDHRGTAEASGLLLELNLPETSPMVRTDGERVRQILGNLLSNAIKYTPAPGRVTVDLRVTDGGQGLAAQQWTQIRVTDTGPGIPPGEHERIFDDFHRLHHGSVEGHGLGLSISRRLARMLGAEITVDSTVGQGSTFSLWIPSGAGVGEAAALALHEASAAPRPADRDEAAAGDGAEHDAARPRRGM